MDKIHVRFSVSQPCLTDAVIVILNGLLSYEHPSIAGGFILSVEKQLRTRSSLQYSRQHPRS